MRKLVLVIFSVFLVFSSIAQVAASTITLELTTDQSAYNPGQAVTFNGKILSDGEAGKGFSPALVVKDSDENPIFLAQWNDEEINEEGSFSTFFTLDDNAGSGTYSATVTAGGKTTVTSFTVSSEDFTKSVSVKTNKSDYLKGQTVTITGTVTQNSEIVKNTTVTILVSKDGNQLKVDQVKTNTEGKFTSSYVLDLNAELGTYSVEAKALEKEVSTTFVVIPQETQNPNPPVIPIPVPSLPDPTDNEAGPGETTEADPAAILDQLNTPGLAKVEVKITKDAVAIPSEVVAKLLENNKALVVSNDQAEVNLSSKTLKDMVKGNSDKITVSVKTVENIGSPTETVKGQKVVSTVFDYNVFVNNQKVTNFTEPVEVKVKVNSVEVKDSRKMAAYYLNESKNAWEYMGGKLNADGNLVFSTNHFSKYAVIYNEKTFTDIKGMNWAQDQIEVLASRTIVKGKSDVNFAPNESVTRAQFAVLVARALNLPKGEFKGTFGDIPASMTWSALEIEAAYEAGIVKGIDGDYRPNEKITREQMATMIVRALEYKNSTLVDSVSTELSFNDSGSIGSYAKESVAVAAKLGIIKGKANGTMFAPKDNATRAESAVMLYRLLDKLGEF